MLKLSSVPMSILNLRVWEKGKLANKWKTTFRSVMKEKDKYKKTPIIFKLFFFITIFRLGIKGKINKVIFKRMT